MVNTTPGTSTNNNPLLSIPHQSCHSIITSRGTNGKAVSTSDVGLPSWERPLIDLTAPSYSGNLFRKSHASAKTWSKDKTNFQIRSYCLVWQRRRGWFHLSSATEILDLRGASVEPLSPAAGSGDADIYPFAVTSADNQYTLVAAAPSEMGRLKWIHQLKVAGQYTQLEDYQPMAVIGTGQWGRVYLARSRYGKKADKEGGRSDGLVAVKEIQLKRGRSTTPLLNERLVLGSLPDSPFGRLKKCFSLHL